MSLLYKEIYVPEFKFDTRTLFWSFMNSQTREGLLTYLKCTNRTGYSYNEDITKLIVYALSEIRVESKPKNYMLYGTPSHFVYACKWLKSPVLQKFNPMVIGNECRSLSTSILLLLILEDKKHVQPRRLSMCDTNRDMNHDSVDDVIQTFGLTYIKYNLRRANDIITTHIPGNYDYIFGMIIDDSQIKNIKSITACISKPDYIFPLDLTKFIEVDCIDQTVDEISAMQSLGINMYTYSTVKMYNFRLFGDEKGSKIPLPCWFWGENELRITLHDSECIIDIDLIRYVKVTLDTFLITDNTKKTENFMCAIKKVRG